MFYNKFVLADGSVLYDNIVSVSWTEQVNSDSNNITPGAVCANAIDISFWIGSDDTLKIAQGTELTYYKVDDYTAVETKIGVFTCEKPEKDGSNKYKVTAYDNVTKLDIDVSDWLNALTFPVSISSFATQLAAKCGLEFANSAPINGDYSVQAFTATNVTGRELMKMVAQATGCFIRADSDGELEYAWYVTNSRLRIAPHKSAVEFVPLYDVVPRQLDDNATRSLTTGICKLANDKESKILRDSQVVRLRTADVVYQPESTPYFSNQLTFSDFTVTAIDKVQVKQSDNDVGVIYPADAVGTNALVISANRLLVTDSDATLRPYVKNLYDRLNNMVYVPCSNIQTPETLDIRAGDIVTVTDGNQEFVTWITSVKHSGNKCTFESVGNANRNTTTAVNNAQYNVNQKIAEVKAGVDGISAKLGEYTTKSEAESLVDIALGKIQLSVSDKTGIYNLFDGNEWVKDGSGSSIGTTGSVSIDGNTVTIVAPDSTEPGKRQGAYWNVPSDKLSYTKGKTLKCSIEYKVNSELSISPVHASHILVWANYASGNMNKIWVYLSTSKIVEPVGDWKTATFELAFKDEVPTRIYAFAYLYGGTGSVSVRNPVINVSASKEKASTVSLEKSGVTISVSELNLGEYATTSELQVGLEGIQGTVTNLSNDYTQFKQTYDSFTATVVTNGEVRSKFALDSSNCTITSGVITFNSNSLVVNSDNFQLTQNGTVTATGSFTSKADTNSVTLGNGNVSISRKISDGSWRRAATLIGYGANDAQAQLQMYANNKLQILMQSSFVGGELYMYHASGVVHTEIRSINDAGSIWLRYSDGRSLFHVYNNPNTGRPHVIFDGELECKSIKRNGTYI